jgi:peptide/nickel transport system substrate-binding protein
MRLFRAALLAAAMTLTLPQAATLAATPADVLVVAANIDDIVSIDPAEAYEFSSGEYVTQTYDRLVQYDAPDVKTLVAGLATEWKADDASKTITFTLRDASSSRQAIRCAPKTSSIPGSASWCSTSRPPSC